MKKKQTREQEVLAYAKTLKFGVLDKDKTTSKYGSYKNSTYEAWKKNGSLSKIKRDFESNDLESQVRWGMGYEATLLDDLVKKEGSYKSTVRYLRTWAKSAFYTALKSDVKYGAYDPHPTDREAQMMATRIYMDNYDRFNKFMEKKFVELISNHFYRSK